MRALEFIDRLQSPHVLLARDTRSQLKTTPPEPNIQEVHTEDVVTGGRIYRVYAHYTTEGDKEERLVKVSG